MKAIILAAGQGSRLRPITNEVPKCMVPLNGTPLIDTIIKRFQENGISDIVVVGGYQYEVLQKICVLSGLKFILPRIMISQIWLPPCFLVKRSWMTM